MNNFNRPFNAPYCGRFAPSPSGPLHMGSLVTALGSWLDAKAHRGQWFLRIEDIDPPRTVADAENSQLAALNHFGLTWDGAVMRQSERAEAYAEALNKLGERLFWCTCRRTQLQTLAPHYAGTCHAQQTPPLGQTAAIRLRGQPANGFSDRQQGWLATPSASNDPILKRRDGLWAYALAVVIDDAAQGITDVVRGADLCATTPVQIMIQEALQIPTPRYLHLPLITTKDGRKLSKQNNAEALDLSQHTLLLQMALSALGLKPPIAVAPTEYLHWAVQHWHQRTPMPLQQSLTSLEKAVLG